MISIIAAYDRNRLIGNKGSMPWYIPGELRRFSALTENNIVIMGRKTYVSLGRPLPDRVNIVISGNENFTADGCYTASSITGAIAMARLFWPDKDIFIGGGAQIYSQTIEMADMMYITEIDGEFEGDTYFPDFDESGFDKTVEARYESTVPYTYVTYRKKNMKDFIIDEKELHPYAQPQDYIKLIFQSEFGPGHLIADPDYAKNRLYEEWQQVRHLPAEANQPIGGGYIRLCIKGIDENRLADINTAFVTSANRKSGSDAGFMEKMELFLQMAENGGFDFDYSAAKQAVDEYLAGGIRPTSHTKIYHSHYTPAYRVVSLKDL